MLYSLVPFESSFCIWCKTRVQSHSLACGYPGFQHHLLKSLFFPCWMLLAPWSRTIWLYTWGLLPGLSVRFHWSLCLSNCSDYYRFVASFEIKKGERERVKLLSRVWLFATPWTVGAYYAPLSMGFSRQEYWSGLPVPSPKKGEAFIFILLLKNCFGYLMSLKISYEL